MQTFLTSFKNSCNLDLRSIQKQNHMSLIGLLIFFKTKKQLGTYIICVFFPICTLSHVNCLPTATTNNQISSIYDWLIINDHSGLSLDVLSFYQISTYLTIGVKTYICTIKWSQFLMCKQEGSTVAWLCYARVLDYDFLLSYTSTNCHAIAGWYILVLRERKVQHSLALHSTSCEPLKCTST